MRSHVLDVSKDEAVWKTTLWNLVEDVATAVGQTTINVLVRARDYVLPQMWQLVCHQLHLLELQLLLLPPLVLLQCLLQLLARQFRRWLFLVLPPLLLLVLLQ